MNNKKRMASVVVVLLHYTCLVSLLSACMATDEVAVKINDDILGLIVFKSDIAGNPNSSISLSSWNEDDVSPCSWRFIQCDPETSRVSGIFLDGLNLAGKIGFGLQKLQHLKTLSLSNNNLTVTSSSRLPNSLQNLNLSNNGISGRIPSALINITSIDSLDLSQNSFSGPVADNFFSGCDSLRFISLARNSFEGTIPTTLSSCSLLTYLNLSSNHFSGNPNFATLQHLQALDLSGNLLSGSLPSEVSSLQNLSTLVLRNNQFSGPIPSDIGLCLHLSKLDLSNNLFTEALPESLERLKSLTFLSLSNNLLSSDFPEWIGNMSSLEIVDLSRNRFSGRVSPSLGTLQSLKFLSLSENGLTGSIPSSLARCSMLSVLRLSRNRLNGDIPTGLFNLGLEEVDLSHNEITGFIPPGSSNLFRSLQVFDLSKNNFRGVIPAEMGLFSNLHYLNLSWNNLHSKIPPEIGYFQNLAVVDLRSNDLYGSIPGDICDSGTLLILQLDSNLLTGTIPEEMKNCSSLYLLSLSHNNLTGPVPESISMLNKLKILKLEFNKLNGEIPQSFGKLENLLAVNISYNQFTGRLPNAGIFPSLDGSSLQGNIGLCSPLLTGPCQMNVPKPLVLDPNSIPNQKGDRSRERRRQFNPSSQHMFLSVSAMVAISATGLVACGVVLVVLLNASARKRLAVIDAAFENMTNSNTSSRSEELISGKLVLFDNKLKDNVNHPQYLLDKASEIGEGVFGTVYKVCLGEQGKGVEVAIKHLHSWTLTQYQEDFDREVRVLAKAKHPNLVSIKGYYWSPEFQLLVTEFAPNGSLQSKLHESLPSSSSPSLSWSIRFKIVISVAKGLAYLHHSFQPSIIHYNIKPGNILLDHSYNTKISDYGLVCLLSKLDPHVLNNRFQSAPGYVAPELACQSLRVTEKCDVYSFGILLLEVVTGRRPVEYREDNVVILNDQVRMLLEQGKVLECVDTSMGEYPEEEVVPVLKLALVCTTQIPSSRPSMDEVEQILKVIKSH